MTTETTTMDVTTAQRAADGLISRHRHPNAGDPYPQVDYCYADDSIALAETPAETPKDNR